MKKIIFVCMHLFLLSSLRGMDTRLKTEPQENCAQNATITLCGYVGNKDKEWFVVLPQEVAYMSKTIHNSHAYANYLPDCNGKLAELNRFKFKCQYNDKDYADYATGLSVALLLKKMHRKKEYDIHALSMVEHYMKGLDSSASIKVANLIHVLEINHGAVAVVAKRLAMGIGEDHERITNNIPSDVWPSIIEAALDKKVVSRYLSLFSNFISPVETIKKESMFGFKAIQAVTELVSQELSITIDTGMEIPVHKAIAKMIKNNDGSIVMACTEKEFFLGKKSVSGSIIFKQIGEEVSFLYWSLKRELEKSFISSISLDPVNNRFFIQFSTSQTMPFYAPYIMYRNYVYSYDVGTLDVKQIAMFGGNYKHPTWIADSTVLVMYRNASVVHNDSKQGCNDYVFVDTESGLLWSMDTQDTICTIDSNGKQAIEMHEGICMIESKKRVIMPPAMEEILKIFKNFSLSPTEVVSLNERLCRVDRLSLGVVEQLPISLQKLLMPKKFSTGIHISDVNFFVCGVAIFISATMMRYRMDKTYA